MLVYQVSQQPSSISLNIDKRGKVQPGRVYNYIVDGHKYQIRDDIAGHLFPDGGYLKPHFNGKNGWHYFYE